MRQSLLFFNHLIRLKMLVWRNELTSINQLRICCESYIFAITPLVIHQVQVGSNTAEENLSKIYLPLIFLIEDTQSVFLISAIGLSYLSVTTSVLHPMESKQQAGGRPAVGDTPEASKVEAYATVGKRVLQRTGTRHGRSVAFNIRVLLCLVINKTELLT